MHRSRVYAVLIDVPRADAERTTAFWAGAFGATAAPYAPAPQFTDLHGALPGLVTAVQALDDGGPRFHLDFETDDVPAETARLVALGAEPVARWEGCEVLRAPGGHLLCVLPVESPPETFAAEARTWP